MAPPKPHRKPKRTGPRKSGKGVPARKPKDSRTNRDPSRLNDERLKLWLTLIRSIGKVVKSVILSGGVAAVLYALADNLDAVLEIGKLILEHFLEVEE